VQGYRRITRACAKRDWDARTHDEALARHRGSPLLRRFLNDDSLDHCYAGANRLDRARDRPRGALGAGPHSLGNLHIRAPAARRAWLWRDTGELDPAWEPFTIDWMIAEGPRRRGHHSDLQVSHADILHDPDDAWLPTEADYTDLADKHEQGWMQRARQAVVLAVREAQARRGELIAVDIDRVSASVAQDFGVSVTVMQEYAERWVIIDRLDTDKQPVDHETAYALADAAFDDVKYEDIEEIFERTEVLGGRHVIDPGRVYAWCAVV
jgi:hypothetical protein